MTTDRETTRIVRSWIQLGVDRMPERVLDAVLDELPATPQRRPVWPAWRSPHMPTFLKVLAPLAAVVVLAVVGLQLLPGGGIGGPAATPSTSPSPTPSPTPSPSPSPTPTASPAVIGMGTADRQLAAGTYRVADPFRPYTISIPATWTLQAAQREGVAMYRTQPANFAPTLVIGRVHRVNADPCHPDLASPSPSPAVPLSTDEIVAQLSAMKGFTAGPVSNVTIGGHPAKAFTVTNALTLEEAQQCAGSPLDTWVSGLGPITTNQGATDQFWVVNVNGTPITINASTFALETPASLRDEVQAVVESIQFDQ